MCSPFTLKLEVFFFHKYKLCFLPFLSVSLHLNLNRMEMTASLTDEGEVWCEMTGEGYVTQAGQIVI